MAEETREMSNLEGALKPFSNTFDSISAEVNAIIAQQDEVMKLYPEQKEVISKMAEDQIRSVLANAGVSPESYRDTLLTEKQYALPFEDSPHTYMKGIARALGQGIFLGAGDELEAFVTHMIKNKLLDNEGNEDQTYMEVLTDIQAGISAFEKANPGVSLTTEIIGGLYFPYYTGLVRGARGLTKGLKLGPGRREALSQGLVGAGAGTFYSYAKDRNVSPLDPLIGGGTAAGFSRALTKTGEVRRQADADIADIEKGFQTQVSGPGGVEVDAQKTIPLMTKLKSKLPNIPAAPGGPPGKPPGELGEAGSQSFHEAAMREIIQAADDEGVTFADLMMRLDDYVKANLGEHTRMIDLVEEGGDLARTIRGVTIDNPKASVAKKSFLKRQIEAKKRTLPKIFSLFDPEGKMKNIDNNIHRWLNKSKEARKTNAQPLYDEFDRITLFDPTQEGGSQLGGQLWNRINTAMEWDKNIKKAWTSAAGKLAWNDPRLAHTLQDNILTGKRFNAFKKKLDGQIGELLAKGNLEEAGDLIKVKNEMIQTVDKIVEEITKAKPGEGVYQRARNIYSGSHASDNAFNLGTGSVKSHSGKNYSADEFEVLFDKLSDSEKAFTRLGLGQGIREVLEKDMTELTPNVRKLILGGAAPNHLERKFHYVFKDDTFEKPVAWLGRDKSGKQRSKEFVNVLNKEAKFLKSYRSLFGGSDTAAKISDVNRITNKISDVVDTVADLGPEALIRQGVPSVGLFSKGGNYISSKFSEAKRRQLAREKYGSEIAELLMTPGGTVNASKLKKVLQDLDSYKNQLDLEKGLLGFSPYKQGTRLGRYSLLQPTTVPEVYFPTDVLENK